MRSVCFRLYIFGSSKYQLNSEAKGESNGVKRFKRKIETVS